MRDVTYKQMHKVLRSLGFTIRVENGEKKTRVYEHDETGVHLPLAYYPDDSVVYPHHLGAIQGTLQVYGIADPIDFLVQLRTAG